MDFIVFLELNWVRMLNHLGFRAEGYTIRVQNLGMIYILDFDIQRRAAQGWFEFRCRLNDCLVDGIHDALKVVGIKVQM